MTAEDRFDVELVAELLRRSLHNEDDVIIDDYLQSYEEINKFFSLMGSVFGFVSSDVRAKIGILGEFLRDEENNKHFYSIKTMLAYEKESGLFNDLNYVSGSRTLLRLHRGLEFVYEFLRLLYDLDDNAKTHMICKKAYNETLAKHHPFLIRKGALVAMYTLPSKTELLKKVCTSVPNALQFLPGMLKQLRNVYDRTQYLYTIFDCLGLP